MIDISKPEVIEILIKTDGKVIWINTENGCIFRACCIKKLIVNDGRK